MRTFAVLALLSILAPTAFGYCYQPSEPDDPPDLPGTYSKPSVPYCLSSYSYSGKHDCSNWELDSYFGDVEDYQRKLRSFVQDLEDYQAEVEDYIDAAAAYAVCEFEDVADQHE